MISARRCLRPSRTCRSCCGAAAIAPAAFVGSIVLDPRTGTAPGFDRGFSTYDAGFRLRNPGEDRYHTLERRGDEVAARAVRWLTALPRSPSEPFFAWVHLFDPHDPYDPPADLKQRFAAAPYDGEIAAVDRAVGTLVAAAGADALIVVAGDHGEVARRSWRDDTRRVPVRGDACTSRS